MSEEKKSAKNEKKAAKQAEKEKLSKMSKEDKKAYKKEKKQEKNTPEAMDFKQNIIKGIAAILCVAIVAAFAGQAVDAYCEAVKLEGQAEAKAAEEASKAAEDAAAQQGTAAPAANNNSYVAPVDNGASVPAGDATAADASGDTNAATPAGDTNTAAPAADPAAAVANAKGITSADAATVVAFYNKAVHATEKNAPKGKQTMKLGSSITGDGALGAVLKVASPIIESTLQRNSTATDYIPGHEVDLTAADVTRAAAKSQNGVTTIVIQLKDQKDGPTADAHNAGPVARGIGTLGNVDSAITELGAELYSGKDSIVLNYNDAYIQCTVDENTGKITTGTWHYKVNVTVGNAEIKLGIKFTAKNLKAVIDYTVVI